MKIWQVEKQCVIKNIQIEPGEYNVSDSCREGFWIFWNGLNIFVTNKESILYGKPKIKIENTGV